MWIMYKTDSGIVSIDEIKNIWAEDNEMWISDDMTRDGTKICEYENSDQAECVIEMFAKAISDGFHVFRMPTAESVKAALDGTPMNYATLYRECINFGH